MTDVITAVLQLVTIGILLAGLYIWQRNRFIVDISRVADLMTAQLLADYKNELWLLDAGGVDSYARHKYTQMVTELGLPSAAVDKVAGLIWESVKAAQGADKSQPETVDARKGNPFYE